MSLQASSSDSSNRLLHRHRRGLVRLGLAWLAMMQVMMFAFPGYLRRGADGQDSLEVLNWAILLMNWASLTLTIPVILYSAWPIWVGCAHAWLARRITMDVPVGISVLAAFVPSAIATFKGSGEVYFDSITMFIAFLLTARYVEQRARSVGPVVEPQAASNFTSAQASLTDFGLPLVAQANRVASLFVMIQLAVAAVIGTIWWVIEPAEAWSVLVSLLVMSCPCALSLAAPVSLAVMQMKMLLCDPLSVLEHERLMNRTLRIARQNLFGALAWHVLTMPLAALGWVTPWLAALSMLLSSVAVLLNAGRIYRSRREEFGRALGALVHNQRLEF